MKLRMLTLVMAALMVSPLAAQARDTIVNIPLADVLAMPEAQGKIDGTVHFYLAGQKTPKVIKTFRSDVTNPKTNGVGKSDEAACKWAILSGLIKLQEAAKATGANAVIDIVSYHDRVESKNASTIECHAATFFAGATLKGSYATVGK